MTEQLPKIDVRPDHWEIVRNILHKHVSQHEVWAFGSRAKWTAKEYSDLDLAVITSKPLSLDVSASLSDDFSESDLPYKVDVVDWATTSESFRKIIERDRVVVQEVGRGWVMGAEWQTVRIGDLGKVVTGKTPSTAISENFGGNYPFITIPDLDGRREIAASARTLSEIGSQTMRSCRLPAGAVMMSCIATIGKCGITASASFTNQQINSLICRDGVDPKFVYYSFSQLGRALEAAGGGGSVYTNVSKSRFESIEIKLPSLHTQKSIVAILAKLDDKIDINRRINQSLETMAQALFQSWFIDFDPVKAKIAALAEGRDPLRAAMSAISGKVDAELDALPLEAFNQLTTTAALFPDEMEASELGEIPRGWSLAELSTFCDLNAGNWSTKTLPTTVKYVDLANTKNGEIIEVQAMGGSDIPSRARRILQPGDTIVGTVRPGNRSYALVAEAGLTGSTGFAVLHPKAKFLREYVYLAATFDENIERLAHLADGGAYPAVRPELVVTSLLPNPDESLLREFHRVSSHMFDQVLGNRKTNQELAQLRDTLLPKLLSGEVSVTQTTAEVAA